MSTAARRVLLLATVAGLSSAGCFLRSDVDSPPPVDPAILPQGTSQPWLVDVAPGHDSWVAVPANADVPKERGFQGGYHVDTSVRVTDRAGASPFTSDLVELEVEVTTEAGLVVSRASSFASPQASPEGAVFGSLRAFVDGKTEGAVLVRVTVFEKDTKRWASGQKRVVVR